MAIYSRSFIQNVIIGDSGPGKTNALLNLIKIQDSDNLINKIYFYAKDLSEPKYLFFIKYVKMQE